MYFTPNYLSQRDPQWADEQLGFDDTVTIGTDGCTLTCLTMLVNGYGLLESPTSLNRKLKAMGSGIGFLGSMIVWPGLTQAFPKINFRRVVVCRYQPAPLEEMHASLDAGQALLVEIGQSPSAGLQYHWVVLYARQGQDYLMLDPWPQPPDNVPTTLMTRYCFGRSPSEFISAVAWYDDIDGPVPAPEPVSIPIFAFTRSAEPAPIPEPVPSAELTQSPIPEFTPSPEPAQTPMSEFTPSTQTPAASAALTVLVSKSIGSVGLRLRDQPATSSNTLAILPAGTELSLLEPADQALSKIGQVNQWLNVRDRSGNPGFVAAWYVELRPPAEPAPVPETSPVPTVLTVLVSSQASAGLHLRDRPNASGTVLEVLMPGTALTVLEPAGTAEAKIGVVNQWLKVRLPGGMTGYVAAWYVTP